MTPKKATVSIMQYTGNGALFQGFPTRDISMDEWSDLDPETCQAAVEAGIYTQADIQVPVAPAVDANPPADTNPPVIDTAANTPPGE